MRAESGLHGQVDFCCHPLLILFSQDGTHQSQTARRIGKQRGDPCPAFDLLVESLDPIGRAHPNPVLGRGP